MNPDSLADPAETSRLDRLIARFSPPRGYWLAIGLAGLIAVPSLLAGFFIDDYGHLLTIEGKNPLATPYDLFQFTPGEKEILFRHTDLVPLPWFTAPELDIHFFRPLSSALMTWDYKLFGKWAPGYHLHSLLWYMALAAGAALLYRRLLHPALAVLALVLFVLEESHFLPVLWWSNRNAVVSALPALLAIWAHLRWREDGKLWGLALSALLISIAFLGSEGALGVAGYLIAYELVAARGPVIKRAAALVPAGLLSVGYLAIYKLGGYGVRGSGVYIDPLSDPVAFLLRVPERLILLIGCQLANVAIEAPAVSTRLLVALVLLSVLGAGFVLFLLMRAWKFLSADERRALKWLALGALLSALPGLATFPSGRLLLLPSFGGCALVAVVIRHAWRARPRWERNAGRILAALHILLPIPVWLGVPLAFRYIDNRLIDVMVAAELDEERIGEQHVILLNAPDPLAGIYGPIMREIHGRPRCDAWTTISIVPEPLRITRTAPNQFSVELLEGAMLQTLFEQLFRTPDQPLAVGDMVQLERMTVRITAVNDAGPTAFEFTGETSFDDPSFAFIEWRDGGLRSTALPAVGDSRDYPKGRGFLDLGFLLSGGSPRETLR